MSAIFVLIWTRCLLNFPDPNFADRLVNRSSILMGEILIHPRLHITLVIAFVYYRLQAARAVAFIKRIVPRLLLGGVFVVVGFDEDIVVGLRGRCVLWIRFILDSLNLYFRLNELIFACCFDFVEIQIGVHLQLFVSHGGLELFMQFAGGRGTDSWL